jgi:hypothetical protein
VLKKEYDLLMKWLQSNPRLELLRLDQTQSGITQLKTRVLSHGLKLDSVGSHHNNRGLFFREQLEEYRQACRQHIEIVGFQQLPSLFRQTDP